MLYCPNNGASECKCCETGYALYINPKRAASLFNIAQTVKIPYKQAF